MPGSGTISATFSAFGNRGHGLNAGGAIAGAFAAAISGVVVEQTAANVVATFSVGGPGTVQVAAGGIIAATFSSGATVALATSGTILATFSVGAAVDADEHASGRISATFTADGTVLVDVPAAGTVSGTFLARATASAALVLTLVACGPSSGQPARPRSTLRASRRSPSSSARGHSP